MLEDLRIYPPWSSDEENVRNDLFQLSTENLQSHQPWSCDEEDVLSDLFHLDACDLEPDTERYPDQVQDLILVSSTGSESPRDMDAESGPETIQSRLQYVAKEGRARRMRISIPAFVVGVTLLVLIGILSFAGLNTLDNAERVDRACTWCPIVYALIWTPSPFVTLTWLLALLPSDTRLVPGVTYFSVFAYILVGVLFSYRMDHYLGASSCVGTNFEAYVEKDTPCWARWCAFGASSMSILNVFFIVFTLCSCVRRTWYKRSHDRSREFLVLLWWCNYRYHVFVAFQSFLFATIIFASGHYMNCLRDLFPGISALIVGVLSFPRFGTRERIQGWLASRSESAAVAAGVAELLGGRKAEDLVAMARESFFYVPASSVRKEHLTDNRSNPELSGLSKKGQLGFVDAFVSHSWHDDAEEKWLALQDWIEAFKAENKREPRLWIDKYCVDQNNIEKNLLCLPVYIASCQRLLVLCGSTYLRRLWCLIEVFVFRQMGGDSNRLDVELLAGRCAKSTSRSYTFGADAEQLQEDVMTFDPFDAKCFSEYDTTRLRHVVEAGGGGMKGLAQFIHDHFVARVEVQKSRTTFSRRRSAHRMDFDERQHLFNDALLMGSQEGAQMLHERLPARYWGCTKPQIMEFIEDVREAVEKEQVKNIFTPDKPYLDTKFYARGPTAHQVNEQYIKPFTDASAPKLPFASYALAKNASGGVDCDLFLSHAWDEGIFEFGNVVSRSWPENCIGAYLCFLSNPQNLNIACLVESPTHSPFYQVLEAAPKVMQMVSNQNSVIHSRLWCVFEAFCAQEFNIPIEIAGDPLWLVSRDKRQAAEALLLQLRAGDIPGRSIDGLLAEIDIDVHNAECFNDGDRKAIWKEIGPRASNVNMMVKELIAAKMFACT